MKNIIVSKKIKNLEKLIGKTPFIKITYEFKQKIKNIYVKLEWYNLTGSIKDRVVLSILKDAYKNNYLKFGQEIIEVTSGNTGISLSAIGAYFGNPVTIYMPDFVSQERKKLIKMFGAKIITYSREQGGFLRCIEESKKNKFAFLSNQFENISNTQSQENGIGKEIINHVKKVGFLPSGFVSGVGTAGTLIGVANSLKRRHIVSKIIAIEPKSSPTLRTGKKEGSHKIEGISDEFIPKLYDPNLIDEILDIDDNDAICMAQKIAKELGLGTGISSGANFLGAVLTNEKFGNNAITIFVDDNKKYISTHLSKVKSKSDFVDNIKLLKYEFIK